MLLGLWCLLHLGGPGVQMTQGAPHHPTRSLGPDREPGGSSIRNPAVRAGVVEQVSLHSGAFPSTLTLGSPEGTLGGTPHGGQQWLWFVVAWAAGCRASHSPHQKTGTAPASLPREQKSGLQVWGTTGRNIDFYNPRLRD